MTRVAARVRVAGRFDMASRVQEATVTIDRERALFAVRPLRRHRIYELPLAHVAEWVVRSIITREVRERREAKRKKRGGAK